MTSSQQRSAKSNRSPGMPGFTLIEVLVVVAIIALLIAILMPSLRTAREASRRVVCESHVKQLSMAMLFHATDDKKGVYIYTTDGADDGLHYLYNRKYMPNASISLCPSTRNVVNLKKRPGKQRISETGATIAKHPDLSVAARNREDSAGGHSYEIFSWHGAGIFPGGLRYDKTERISLPTTRRPHLQFIIVDSDQDPENNGNGSEVLGSWVYNNWPDQATNNHGKAGGNIGFLDGHVEWVTHRNWVPVHLKAAHGAWPEELARKTYFPGLRKEARTDGGDGYKWYLH